MLVVSRWVALSVLQGDIRYAVMKREGGQKHGSAAGLLIRKQASK